MDGHKALIWLIFNIVSIAVLAFYSMMEMACVSFSKVRLQYYVSKGYKRAIWVNELLHNPSRLFGTTLIGVNIALVIGSECSREFHASLGLSPDWAPLSQVILVVIFGELAPMFAARHYAESVAMLGAPLIYASSKLMAPLLWGVELISKLCNLFINKSDVEANIYLNQEELLKVLEEQGAESTLEKDSSVLSTVASNIFDLRVKNVRHVMDPLSISTALPSNATIAQMEAMLSKTGEDYLPVYNREISNIVGIAYPREFVRAPEKKRVRDYTRPPWFVTEATSIMQLLKQFRSTNESVAIIINQQGKAVGLVDLTNILDKIFGQVGATDSKKTSPSQKIMLIEKTFPSEMTVGEFNTQFGVKLADDPSMTLANLMAHNLGHRPEKGESVYLSPFELTVKETSLLDVKTISISTRR